MKIAYQSLIAVLLLAGDSLALLADESKAIYPGELEIGTTLMALAGNGDSVDAENSGMAFDIFTMIPTRRGTWGLLIEATARPLPALVSRAGQAAGNINALGHTRSGEARLAELHYGFSALGGDWSVGLLDSKVHIDGSTVANDDKEQFLGPAFVNNPSIALPENGLGIAYRHEQAPRAPGYSLLTTAHESNLVGVDSNFENLFIAAESFRSAGNMTARLGAWSSRSRRPANAGFSSLDRRYGLYASLDMMFTDWAWNIRAGSSRVGRAGRQSFLGVTAQIPLRQNMLGIGVGRSLRFGDALTGGDGHSSFLEIFYRFTVGDRFVITPDLQYQRISKAAFSENVFSACLRMRLVI